MKKAKKSMETDFFFHMPRKIKMSGIVEKYKDAVTEFKAYAKWPKTVNVKMCKGILKTLNRLTAPKPRRTRTDVVVPCGLCGATGPFAVDLAPEGKAVAVNAKFNTIQGICARCITDNELNLKTCAMCLETKAYPADTTFPTLKTMMLHAGGRELFVCKTCCSHHASELEPIECPCCVCEKKPDLAPLRVDHLQIQVCFDCVSNTPTKRVVECMLAKAKECDATIKKNIAEIEENFREAVAKMKADLKESDTMGIDSIWNRVGDGKNDCKELGSSYYDYMYAKDKCNELIGVIETVTNGPAGIKRKKEENEPDALDLVRGECSGKERKEDDT